MLEVEDQLRKYGEAVERAALVAPLEGPLVDDEPGPVGDSGRGRTRMLVALTASLVLVVGVVTAARQGRSERVDTANGTSDAQIEAEWAGYAVPAYVTDAAPAGMTVSATMSAADYDAPVWTMHSQQYWVEGKTVPEAGDHKLVISWFVDDGSDSALYGEPVTIRGTEGVFRKDVVTFVDDGFQVVLSSSTFSTNDLVDFAEQLTIAETGVQELEDLPGGLTALPVRRSMTYEQYGATVPFDGHTATYSDGSRELNIFTAPLDGNEQAAQWLEDVREVNVGDRTVWIRSNTDHPPTSVIAVWVEGDAQITVFALDVTEEEVLAVIAASRQADRAEW
ncbi:MAG: hypothetical protein ACRBK7_02760 [Acidimicrobiales bacterium]